MGRHSGMPFKMQDNEVFEYFMYGNILIVKFLKLAKPEIKLKFSSSEHSGLVLKGYMWL